MKENKTININISMATIANIFLFGLLIFLLYVLRDIVMVLLVAIVLASFIQTVVKRFEGKINRNLAVILIYFVTLAFLGLIFYLLVPAFIQETSTLLSTISKYIPQAGKAIQGLDSGTIDATKEIVTKISTSASLGSIIESVKSMVGGLSGGFLNAASVAFGGVVNLILIIVFSFFLSIQKNGIENFLRIIIPAQYEDYAVDLWLRTEKKIALWIKGQLVLGLIIGVLIYLGMAIMDVHYAFLLAMLAAIGELVPFGLYLAMIPGVAFAYLDGGLTLSLMVLGFWLIVQQFEHYLIYPLVVRRVVGVPPLIVILSILIGMKLAGFWGLILGIPVAVCILEFMGDVEKKKISCKVEK